MSRDLYLFVSEALRRKRHAAGLSIEDMANLTQIPAEKLLEYEADSRGMDFPSMQALADALNEDVAAFFAGYVLKRYKTEEKRLDG